MVKFIKQIFIFAILSILLFEVTAQQLPQYSQYLINDYVLNPAIGGSKAYYETKSNHRFQWIGITDAPRTFILSMHGPLKAENMGVGGYLFTDVTGPTSRVGAYGSYSYHVQLNETMKLSMGLFGGIVQYNIDGSKITLVDKTDPLGSVGIESAIIPDAGFGLYWYTEDYYLGASIPQLLQNKLKLSDTTNLTGKLNSHYYLLGGYKFKIGTDFEIEPSFLMKMVIPVPMQFDISSKVIYQKMVWVGASYRTFDSMSALIGYSFEEKILFGYSFDFTLSDLKNYNSGTHEVMLGLRFASSKKKKIEKKEEGLFE